MEKYSETAKVRTSDADSRANIKLPSILEFMQEAATDHADIIGVGRKDILPKNLGWALTKLHLKIDSLPRWQERVKIETWPSSRSKVMAEREFVLSNLKDGEVCARARTQWVLINLQTRRLERITSINSWEDDLNETAFESDMRFPAADEIVPEHAASCTVRKEDIDLNMHVNNAVYLTWALEAVPNEFFMAHRPRELMMSFISEVSPGNCILSECRFDGLKSTHSIRLAGTRKECARVNIDWTSG